MNPTTSHSNALRVVLWGLKGAGLHYGGYGMTAYRLYSAAEPGRFDITLVHGNSSHEDYDLFKQQVCLYDAAGRGTYHLYRFIRRGYSWLKKHFSEHDVFHGLSGYQFTFGPALYARKLGLPAVVKLAGNRAELVDKRGWKQWFGLPKKRRQNLGRLSGVIAISSEIRDELLEYGLPERKIAMIPNGVDADLFRPIRDKSEKAELKAKLGWPDLPIVLFAGVINRRKQPGLLIEAIAELVATGKECRLVLAGPIYDADRPYAESIKAKVEELGVSSSVQWHGMSRDMANLYRAADIFSLPSSSEGMANAVLEAMASGLPSVVTRVSGMSDLIADGASGRLVAADKHQLAEAIGWYLDHPSEIHSHGKSARDHIVQKFSAKAVAKAHENLFRGLVSGGDAATYSLLSK